MIWSTKGLSLIHIYFGNNDETLIVEVTHMKKGMSPPAMPADEDAVTLTISPEKVCFIIIKAREFDAKEEVNEPDPGSNPSDDKEAAVLEDREDDPVVEELTSLINSLSEDEQIDLVTLAWLGRDCLLYTSQPRHVALSRLTAPWALAVCAQKNAIASAIVRSATTISHRLVRITISRSHWPVSAFGHPGEKH